ncbi:hypothetical protein [Rhizobacter sp. P5_C2]
MTHVEEGQLDPGLPAIVPTRALSPKERLAASRESIRHALVKASAPRDPDAPSAPQEPGWLGTLGDALSDLPAAAIAVRWLRRWWAGHPWRTTFEFARDAGQELAGPLAKRHPWWLLAGAFVGGMLLTRAKPWRWISGGALLAGVLPRLDLASIISWVNLAIADFTRPAASASTPAPTTAPPAEPSRPSPTVQPSTVPGTDFTVH